MEPRELYFTYRKLPPQERTPRNISTSSRKTSSSWRLKGRKWKTTGRVFCWRPTERLEAQTPHLPLKPRLSRRQVSHFKTLAMREERTRRANRRRLRQLLKLAIEGVLSVWVLLSVQWVFDVFKCVEIFHRFKEFQSALIKCFECFAEFSSGSRM